MLSSVPGYRGQEADPTVMAEPRETTVVGGSIRTFFILIAAGLLCATLVGAATAWDGGYILFKVLQTQAPFIAHDRPFVIPLQYVVLLASRFTTSSGLLESLFTLTYALLPLLALVASWLIVRREAPMLFVWAVFGIALGTLPGQFSFTTEANTAVQFFWPIALAFLTRLQRRHLPIVIASTLLVFLAHPIAAIIFLIVGVLALLVGWREPARRLYLWKWAGSYCSIGLFVAARFFVVGTTDEAGQVTMASLQQSFLTSVVGFPLIFLLGGTLAAILVAIAPFLVRRGMRRLVFLLYGFELVSILGGGGLLLVWASDSFWWRGLIGFRAWGLAASVPFILLLTVEGIGRYGAIKGARGSDWLHRIRTIQVLGLMCALVLAVQSLSWLQVSNRLDAALTSSKATCVSTSSLPWLNRTPLNYWSISAYSLMLQGSQPDKLLMEGNGCDKVKFAQGIPLTSWDTIVTNPAGWFDLRAMGQHLIDERQQ